MKSAVFVALVGLAACAHPGGKGAPDAGSRGPADAPDASSPPSIFDSVDPASLMTHMANITGAQGFAERWSPAAKQQFRAYWESYMKGLGMTTDEVTFPESILAGETEGHDVEAILPGASADSVVIIVHYDTVGIAGKEQQNPGADDDGSGLAMEMEAARLFAQIPDRTYTVRFVAADYEEISGNLDGDYAYVTYLQKEAAAKGFKILVASDDDQTGWSCWSENLCTDNAVPRNTTFQVIDCSGDAHHYAYPDLGNGMVDVATRHGSAEMPKVVCDGSGDTDHYPFWVAGIPAYVIEEYGSENNPHYDDAGGDTVDKIDFGLLTATARIQIAYQAELAGIGG